MPAASPDDLYWNPMDLECGEPPAYPKQYIDPWDLENYAYIQQHLDSVDSEQEAGGTPEMHESLYYVPAKSISIPLHEDEIYAPRKEKIYNTAPQDMEYYYTMKRPSRYDRVVSYTTPSQGTYAAVDDYVRYVPSCTSRRDSGCIPGAPTRRRPRINDEDIYDLNEYTDVDLYGNVDHGSLQIYEKNKTMRRLNSRHHRPEGPVAKMAKSRSYSFSMGDYEYDTYKINQPIYGEDVYNMRSDIYDSTGGSSPIYDDIRSSHSRSKPRHFKQGNYGHLKIDYSFSWNNLNKYIYK